MMTQLQQAMTAGVFVEFRDPAGNTVGQALFTDWQARPLPNVGDEFCCAAVSTSSRRAKKLRGRVVTRHFDVQREEGQPCVWVRIEAVVTPSRSAAIASRTPFSLN